MAGVTYKCPHCGAYLEFDPESGAWRCPFCQSGFTQADLQPPEASAAAQVAYHCPNCGSEILTDETTAATRCYYCHSPVVLLGRVADELKPDSVLPFSIGREKAEQTFLSWVKTKRFVPKGFFQEAKLDNVSGVYYPHFISSCDLQGTVDGEGRQISVVSTARYVVTTTRHYHVRREGSMHFEGIIRPALKSADRKLSDGIHPFPLEKLEPFSGAYLAGFLAERRDMEAQDIQEDVRNEVAGYVEPLLTDDLHYDSYNVTSSADVTRLDSRYALLPAWVITYPNAKDPAHPYYYAMNGCTGAVCGKLPVNRKKLWAAGVGVAAAVFAVGLALSYFLF